MNTITDTRVVAKAALIAELSGESVAEILADIEPFVATVDDALELLDNDLASWDARYGAPDLDDPYEIGAWV